MDPVAVSIVAVTPVGPDTIAVELEAPEGFSARPGQFVKFSAVVDGEHIARFYTLSSPSVDETFEVTVDVDPDGTLGPWLETAVGEEVTLEGPYGTAYYEDESAVVILAGGPGIGPAIGIAERALDDGGSAAIVFHGDGAIHRERLDRLRARGARVVVTDGPLEDHVEGLADEGQVFVFGFQEFVSEAIAALEAAGRDPDAAKVENFG